MTVIVSLASLMPAGSGQTIGPLFSRLQVRPSPSLTQEAVHEGMGGHFGKRHQQAQERLTAWEGGQECTSPSTGHGIG